MIQLLEGTFAIFLSTFLLVLIIAVSQNIRSKLELLGDLEDCLKIETNMLRICRQKLDREDLLQEMRSFLDSNGFKWVSIEIFSEKHGVEYTCNNGSEAERDIGYIRIVRITVEDVVVMTVGVEND